jgi:hypothetical protein
MKEEEIRKIIKEEILENNAALLDIMLKLINKGFTKYDEISLERDLRLLKRATSFSIESGKKVFDDSAKLLEQVLREAFLVS